LAEALDAGPVFDIPQHTENIINNIKKAVWQTSEILPELREAGVIDSGALGIFLFFEGFFMGASQKLDQLSSPHRAFNSKIKIYKKYRVIKYDTYCINSVIVAEGDIESATQKIAGFGQHVVARSDGRHLKIHLHADDARNVKKKLASMGEVVEWHIEKIDSGSKPLEILDGAGKVHVVTDAAGSMSSEDARELGVTLLDSYIMIDELHLPESAVSANTLYTAMKRGVKVTTAQASTFERRQNYEYLTQRYDRIIYLSVGSAYTGNYDTARRWATENEEGRRMTVVDTGAASGRLGLIARCVAHYTSSGAGESDTARFARGVCRRCNELVFLDQLKYLAAGGRISKTNGFLGDMLKIKPIIRPGADGAQKVGVVRNRQAQVAFALNHLGHDLDTNAPVKILLQYTDNQDWVASYVQPRIQLLLPAAQMQVAQMSLTAGAHMGPGTWALAYLPIQSALT
jgi:uncharacterized protein